VEFVRSCHHGTWKLFQDSDVETTGRYYFAPPDTPHYPGFHNLWSADWTYEREEVYTPPTLGENREKRLGYSKGNLGIAHPAAITLGSATCIESGEVLNPQVEPVQRRLVNGIPEECWQGSPPDPVPVLWLKPESLEGLADFDQVPKWLDSSVYGNNAVQIDPDLRPVKQSGDLFPYAEFTFPQVLDFLRVVRLKTRWTVFALYTNLFWSGSGVVNTTVLSGAIRVTPTQWRHPPSGATFVRNWPGPGALPGLMGLRRSVSSFKLTRGLTDEMSFGVLLDPFASQIGVNVVAQSPFGTPIGGVYELKVYDTDISDDLYAAELAYFAAKYAP